MTIGLFPNAPQSAKFAIMRPVNHPLHKGDYIGFAAFAGIVIAAYSAYFTRNTIPGEPWQIVVTFVTGGLFLAFGIFSASYLDEQNKRHCAVYFVLQAILSLTAVWTSPLQGFFGILCLPLASQAVFLFRWYTALTLGLFLWVGSAAVYYPSYGWEGLFRGLLGYSPAYLFTVGFSFVTVDAVFAHQRSAELAGKLEAANQRLREYAAQAGELATTRERNRLAREIHDGVGHYLTVINVQLDAARAILTDEPAKASAALEKATRLSREALDDVRRSVGSLRSEEVTASLTERVRALAKDAGLPVDLAIEGSPRKLPSAAEHALYRAAQEGLTNVRKHANANQARVRLDFQKPARVNLSVIDDGNGNARPMGNDDHDAGFGLRGMRERIGLLGGRVEARPRSGGGFELTVEVPA